MQVRVRSGSVLAITYTLVGTEKPPEGQAFVGML
jgi:hypothetical protein